MGRLDIFWLLICFQCFINHQPRNLWNNFEVNIRAAQYETNLWHWIAILRVAEKYYSTAIICSTILIQNVSFKGVPKVWPVNQMWPSYQLLILLGLLELDISELPQFLYLYGNLNSQSLWVHKHMRIHLVLVMGRQYFKECVTHFHDCLTLQCWYSIWALWWFEKCSAARLQWNVKYIMVIDYFKIRKVCERAKNSVLKDYLLVMGSVCDRFPWLCLQLALCYKAVNGCGKKF